MGSGGEAWREGGCSQVHRKKAEERKEVETSLGKGWKGPPAALMRTQPIRRVLEGTVNVRPSWEMSLVLGFTK